jgi:hypothetical protein
MMIIIIILVFIIGTCQEPAVLIFDSVSGELVFVGR